MSFVEPGVQMIMDLIASGGYPGLALLMALDATIFPVPSAAVMGFAGYLSYLGRFDIVLVTIVGALGSTGGSLLMYAVGRWGGRPFVDRFGRYIGLGDKKMRSAEAWFVRYGDRAVLLSQLLPIARDLIPFPAGTVKMDAGRFALFSFLGSLPFCLILAGAGLLSGPAWGSAVELIDRYDMVVLAISLLIIVAYLLLRWSVRRTKRHSE